VSRLVCPFCGPRELREFHFHKTLPTSDASSTPYQRVYERLGRLDSSIEHWQHTGGCRSWLLVRRNPSTGDVHEITELSGGVR